VAIGYPEPSTPSASATMRWNTKCDMHPEVRLRSGLHRARLWVRVQRQIAVVGISARSDLVFGPSWSVVRIWDHQVVTETVAKVVTALGREP
jgi:hypothetical protein